MSFLAKLYIEDKERNVLSCTYNFSQEIDYSGRAIARPKSGLILLIIESSNDTDILHWMISSQEIKTGEIVFFRRDSSSANKKLKFTDALYVDYTEIFNSFSQAKKFLNENNIGCHAGHGLTASSLKPLITEKLFIEYNIGHWIISESLFSGLKDVVSKLKQLCLTGSY